MFSTAAPRKNPESRGACVGGAIKPAFTPPVVDEQPTVTKPATLNTSASNTTRRRSFRSRPEQQLFSIFASNFFMDLVALTRHSTSSVPTFNYPLLVPLIQTLRQQMTRTNFRRRLLKYRFWLWRARRVPSEISVALEGRRFVKVQNLVRWPYGILDFGYPFCRTRLDDNLSAVADDQSGWKQASAFCR